MNDVFILHSPNAIQIEITSNLIFASIGKHLRCNKKTTTSRIQYTKSRTLHLLCNLDSIQANRQLFSASFSISTGQFNCARIQFSKSHRKVSNIYFTLPKLRRPRARWLNITLDVQMRATRTMQISTARSALIYFTSFVAYSIVCSINICILKST